MPTRNALLVLVAATLLGIVFTLFAGSEPGFLLGFFIAFGSVAAALGVRRGAVHLIFPLPAFAFFAGAVITGKVKDSALGSTTTGLSVGFLQWIADIFLPMVIATVLVMLAGGARWLLARQLVTGQFSASAGRPAGDPGPLRPGQERPGDRFGTAPRPGPHPPRPDRGPRDQRPDRDAWGDRRQPDPGQTRDRTPRPPGSEPRSPRTRQSGQPPRPPRPLSPRDPWDQP